MGREMLNYLAVAVGSALGGLARYGCTLLASTWLGDAFPWGTIIINAIGSFIIGFFATATGTDGRYLVRSEVRVFVMVGICGGYTTFSSFSLQTFLLLRNGAWLAALSNIVVSMVLCLAAVWLGHSSAVSFNNPPRSSKQPARPVPGGGAPYGKRSGCDRSENSRRARRPRSGSS